jgi:hypothetical protein
VLTRKSFFKKVIEWLPGLQQLRTLTADLGGFQSFVGEKEKFEFYEQDYVSTVATMHYAVRTLEISDAHDAADLLASSAFDAIDVDAALTFLSASLSNDGLFKLAPEHKRPPTVATIYHGAHAWQILSLRRVPSVKGADSRSTAACAHFALTMMRSRV